MLHHLSIAVHNPSHVGQVLAEILQGRVFPFPVFPDSYIVVTGDDYGTAIEIEPIGLELIPGETEVISQVNPTPSRFSATHIAVTTPLSPVEIEAIAQREGWLVRYCDRGPFDLTEVWVENHLLIECLSPEMSQRYLNFMTIANFEEFLKTA
ncbi:conserved hypothetical protein [Rippkaea orientalis PCC 8801]|uniref:VOC domain-containing protein n=1 Tax=Rippkaea orientalis (strain PCC 8801 / RF-1) TaxID=41431 RepID=B7JWF4_RIPO1|nr:hypothetical protein [Rippkaea orientalis]ACK66999.1 conserved hypothetical protein [Rippkaea orientalis PCC 8801]